MAQEWDELERHKRLEELREKAVGVTLETLGMNLQPNQLTSTVKKCRKIFMGTVRMSIVVG